VPRSLYAKLALGLTALLVGMGLVYTLVTLLAARHYLHEVTQEFNRNLARDLVMERNLVHQGRIDAQALEETFHHYMVVNPSIEIYLLDLQGDILSYSADPGVVKRGQVALEPIRAFLAGADAPVLGDDPRHPQRRKEFSVTPVPSATDPEGYLYVILRGQGLESLERALQGSYLLQLSTGAVAASLVFGLLAGLAVFRLLTRRLHRLAKDIDRFRESGFRAPVHYVARAPGRGDEVDRLGSAFDQMAERIVQQMAALEERDASRRELVAHVSHDLRTPLAALHGYLETLQLKSADLDAAERADYLATALRHSERLRRRVDELFELATLDARDVQPTFEPCAVADLVQDVVQKYTLEARARDVTLVADVCGEPPSVPADAGLLERLLENLIENALEHTPARGRIDARVSPDSGRALIEVTDTGPGIGEAEIGQVFERFYRGGNAGRGEGHAGLGLAIAKRIAELHGGDIRVWSRLGEGATFTVVLPARAGAAPR